MTQPPSLLRHLDPTKAHAAKQQQLRQLVKTNCSFCQQSSQPAAVTPSPYMVHTCIVHNKGKRTPSGTVILLTAVWSQEPTQGLTNRPSHKPHLPIRTNTACKDTETACAAAPARPPKTKHACGTHPQRAQHTKHILTRTVCAEHASCSCCCQHRHALCSTADLSTEMNCAEQPNKLCWPSAATAPAA